MGQGICRYTHAKPAPQIKGGYQYVMVMTYRFYELPRTSPIRCIEALSAAKGFVN